jgi:outer membrane lipoprotein-sorting protein
MKKTLLLIVSLLLCLMFLTSCADIKAQQSVSKLDELQARLEQDGYECTRWQDTGIASYAESLVSESGVLLKGEITGMMEYAYRDESANKYVYGVVVGTTNKSDSKAVGEVYAASLEGVVTDMETTVQTYYVQIEYTLS